MTLGLCLIATNVLGLTAVGWAARRSHPATGPRLTVRPRRPAAADASSSLDKLLEEAWWADMPDAELLDLDAVPSRDDLLFADDLLTWSTPPAGPGLSPIGPGGEWDVDDEGWRGTA